MQRPADVPPAAPSLREALRFWAWLGCVSFGGPAGQIALMHHELVERRRWISERRFLHALNYCMVLPGPEAQQLATYIGWLLHRSVGGLAAGALFVLPSLLLLIVLSWIYVAYGDVPLVAGLFYGIKPAVTAIVLHAAWRIGSRVLRNALLWAIAAAAFVAIYVFALPFPAIVAAAALVGAVGARVAPARFTAGGGGHASASAAAGAARTPALIDDDTPPPAHAGHRPARLLAIAGGALALWALGLGALAAALGAAHPFVQMGWFFTKAALLTFGGAYAVLPYVVQGAVDRHGWLGATQMIDGLALGETTPGPLIMVVTFVGFVGGWNTAPFGDESRLAAAVAAALLVTWFTFLPSFVFILAGAPVVEATHGQLALTAPLTAITAAVVGVIVNLALFFGAHVLWPAGGFDAVAALLALAAALALFRWRRSVIEVIGASALLGLAASLLR